MDADLTNDPDVEAAAPPDPAQAAGEAASIRPAEESEHARVADALTHAFYDDPVMNWFFPDDSRRMGQLEGLFSFFGGEAWFPHELTYTTDAAAGAAAWVPPDKWRVSILEQLRMMPGFVSAIGWRDLPRSLRGFNMMESKHPHEPHYYLPAVGVRPEWQGKGLGSALLRPMLERCDRERSPAYLEATAPRNKACYERLGFEVTHELTFPKGPTMFGMWREPGAGE
jgi:GNAT superfamily N-acetyltransferase